MFVFASGVLTLRRLDNRAIEIPTLLGKDWDIIFGFCHGWLSYTVGSKSRVLYLLWSWGGTCDGDVA